MAATSTHRTIDLPRIGNLAWTYRLVDAEVSVGFGEIPCLDIGTVVRVFRDGDEELVQEPIDQILHDYLTEMVERYTLDHAHEIANEIMTNRLAALLKHRPECNRSADFGGRDWCNCGRDEERLGRQA